jgi:large subunit ribosomal protein L3
MINGLIGKKISMTQDFDKDGRVVPLTIVSAGPCRIVQIKDDQTDGYQAVKLAYGQGKGKYSKKPTLGELKKAGLNQAAGKLAEIRGQDSDNQIKVGQEVTLGEVFAVDDKVMVTGQSKGRGFAGVIKRHGFHGGPATHGQSDRRRAPGSIGQGTDQGKVHRGKKMPGHYGVDQVTVKNLTVFKIDEEKNYLYLSGAVPGSRGGYLIIKKK